MGLHKPVWPLGITPEDCIIHAQAEAQYEIQLTQSHPLPSQEQVVQDEVEPQQAVQEPPLSPNVQEQANDDSDEGPVTPPHVRRSERIKQILFNKQLPPGPGLDPTDAISVE